jgi:murein tripeptide amidase MpaA
MTVNEFSHVVRRVHVGHSYLNQSIPGFLLASGLSEDNWEAEAMERPAILINGGHHARELTSTTQCLYYMMHLLFDHTEGVSSVENLLETSAIFIIPIVNIDAYDAMSHHYFASEGEWKETRKNRHHYESQKDCST